MRYCAIDVETMGNENELKPELNCQKFTLGEILMDNGVSYLFTDPNEMVKKLIDLTEKERNRGGRLYIYGWNTQYDFYAIFRDYLKKNLIIEFNNGKILKYFSFYPFMAMYGENKPNGKFKTDAYYLDMMSFFRTSLDSFGKMINMNKLKMPENPQNIGEIIPYLHRDCEITIKSIKLIRKIVNDMGFYPKRFLTAGNVAITCFLTWCKKKDIAWVFSYKGRTYQGKYINKFRSAFRGGRFECFQTGYFPNCTKIDACAMYPYLMANMDFPDLRYEYYTNKKEDIQHIVDSKIGIVKCRVKAPQDIKYGYLPIRIGNMTYYPIGKELEGTWTTLEIKRAIELGYKILYYKEAVYFNKAPINPFKEYMEYLWNIRKKKEGVEKEVIKLLMNSLFGKWSQYKATEEFKFIKRGELNKHYRMGYRFLRTAEDRYIMTKKGGMVMPRYANPMISIWITALGRDYLYQTMKKIDIQDLVYVATDGLIIKNFKNDGSLNIGNEFGQFKIEDVGYCKMLGENRYKFNDTIKIGGIPKKDVNEDVFEGKRTVKTSKMISIKQALNDTNLQDKIGTFREEEVLITMNKKTETLLPDIIVETDKFRQENGI